MLTVKKTVEEGSGFPLRNIAISKITIKQQKHTAISKITIKQKKNTLIYLKLQ